MYVCLEYILIRKLRSSSLALDEWLVIGWPEIGLKIYLKFEQTGLCFGEKAVRRLPSTFGWVDAGKVNIYLNII
jgi:hypothetical protein